MIVFIIITSSSPKLYEDGIIIATFRGIKSEPQRYTNLFRATQQISGRFRIALIDRTLKWQPGVLVQILTIII